MGKDISLHDGFKKPGNYLKNADKIFFDPKFSKTFYFCSFLVQKFDESSEPIELNKRKDACHSAK